MKLNIILLLIFLIFNGCSDYQDSYKNREKAVDMVVNYILPGDTTTLYDIMNTAFKIEQQMNNILTFEGWNAKFVSGDVYRVWFSFTENSISASVIFVVDTKSGVVKGVNKSAQMFLTIQRNFYRKIHP